MYHRLLFKGEVDLGKKMTEKAKGKVQRQWMWLVIQLG